MTDEEKITRLEHETVYYGWLLDRYCERISTQQKRNAFLTLLVAIMTVTLGAVLWVKR